MAMTETPGIQRAWTVVRRGKPANALQLKTDWPVPKKLEKGEVLVRIQAGALNPLGWKLMRVLPNLFANRPHVAEHDFSGVIIDANGTDYSNGDNVFGWIPSDLQQKTRQGVLAEYARIPAGFVALRPDNVTPVQAAGFALTAMTSYQALYKIAKLEPEQTILVNGGSTSAGTFAIQLAKAVGAKVVATASGRNEEFVRKQGADEFIDYTKQPLVQYLSENPPATKYHVIYDAVGLIDPSLFTHSAKYLAPKGIFISTGPLPKNLGLSEIWNVFRTIGAIVIPSWLGNVNRRYSIVMVKHNDGDMKEIQKLLADGSLKPNVDSVFAFEDAIEAYNRLLTGRATGKVVVKVHPMID